ncbi:MAG TPA: hypothetical protein VLT86_05860 [Vicinamibacterales bacterium]|nr:hypothetical protein [Vicinamibacterales bacterium]
MKADTAPVHFFAPSPASRMRWDITQDTPLPPEMKIGDSVPANACGPARGTVR